MKRFLVLLIAVFSIISFDVLANDAQLKQAFESHQSDVQIKGGGKVVRLLPDDNRGSKHQKFILKLKNHQTLLISHNIDLAPKISNLKVGDYVKFYGEYEWSRKGGVIHWTHRDPHNKHKHGWLKHKGKVYK